MVLNDMNRSNFVIDIVDRLSHTGLKETMKANVIRHKPEWPGSA